MTLPLRSVLCLNKINSNYKGVYLSQQQKRDLLHVKDFGCLIHIAGASIMTCPWILSSFFINSDGVFNFAEVATLALSNLNTEMG